MLKRITALCQLVHGCCAVIQDLACSAHAKVRHHSFDSCDPTIQLEENLEHISDLSQVNPSCSSFSCSFKERKEVAGVPPYEVGNNLFF